MAGNEAAYLSRCVETTFVSSIGPDVSRFEEEFAQLVDAPYAVACSSGTAALHVALRLAGVVAGDLVAVPDFTFIASVNGVSYLGATPLLVDSERETWNLDGERLLSWLRERARLGRPLPRAIVAVHIYGHPADLEPLVEAREMFDIPLIEDAAEAVGSRYTGGPFSGRHVGTIGDIGCYSFNGNKIITSGGGGMITTADPALAQQARHLTTQARASRSAYWHDDVGYNYRMINIAAALGRAQLEQLDAFLAAKRAIARRYDDALGSHGLTLPPDANWASPNRWLYSVLLPQPEQRDTIAAGLAARGIETRPVWVPMHRQPPYVSAERLGGEVSDDLYDRGLSLPTSVGLSETDQCEVVEALLTQLAG